MVYVLGYNGQPLMPTCRHGKIRHLLDSGKAKVVWRCPFTIKLLYESTTYTQNLTLGQDTGSGTLATAVVDSKGFVVYMSEVTLRNDISERLSQRSRYRRNRRSRKTRYRKARFLNRRNSIRKDRFSPTMVSKFYGHVKEIEFIKKLLPVTRMVLETGTFNPHLMKDPMLAYRPWGYQKGPNYGFGNTKAMVLNRDNYTCQHCKGKHKDSHLEVHHIVYRSQGGSDAPENLITLCHTCHTGVHKSIIKLQISGKKKGSLKYATQMNSIRCQLLKSYPDAIETFGYITKENRQLLGVPKEHYYDACTIASGGDPFVVNTLLYRKRCIPAGDFQQTKGVRSEQKITTGKILGFRKFDKVSYMGSVYFIKGRMSSGYAVLMDLDGNKADFSQMPKGFRTPKLSNLTRLEARPTWMTIPVVVTQNTA